MELNEALQALMARGYAAQGYIVAVGAGYNVVVRRGKVGRKGYHAGLGGRKPHGHHVVALAERGYGFAAVLHAAHGVSDHRESRVEAQLAAVIGVFAVAGHGYVEVAEGLVRHAVVAVGTRHDVGVGQVLSLTVLALGDELAHPGQRGLGAGVEREVGLACPDGFLVELHTLHGGVSEHHAAQTPVAHGQCLRPCHGRAVVPQFVLLCQCAHCSERNGCQ